MVGKDPADRYKVTNGSFGMLTHFGKRMTPSTWPLVLRCMRTQRNTKGSTVVTTVGYIYQNVGYEENEG
jgi:hypothetical protein